MDQIYIMMLIDKENLHKNAAVYYEKQPRNSPPTNRFLQTNITKHRVAVLLKILSLCSIHFVYARLQVHIKLS